MMIKEKQDWLQRYEQLGEALREEAKNHMKLTELEDLVTKYGKQILETAMQGVVDDKGDGTDLVKDRKGLKNKGIKKKT